MTMAAISGVVPFFVFGCNDDDDAVYFDDGDDEDYPNSLLLMYDDDDAVDIHNKDRLSVGLQGGSNNDDDNVDDDDVDDDDCKNPNLFSQQTNQCG